MKNSTYSRRSVARIAVADTRTPRCNNSPWMRWYPQRGFSMAKLTMLLP
jgi:hypothetical protein